MRYIRTNSLKRLFSIRKRSFDGDITSLRTAHGEEDNKDGLDGSDPAAVPFLRPSWRCYSYKVIFEATDGFSSDNLVGKGGYAEVYRGNFGGDSGEEIAVKRLTKASTDERKVKEFLTEIGTIGHVRHPNVLSLLGCCVDNGLYIIFRFSSGGSLASLLHDEASPTIDWKTRYKIAAGTARGLHYLHKGCQRRIIHRDIKSSNILLTSELEPLISDFGLAKWLPWQWSHHSIAPIEGTFGHLAPEYFMHGIVDEKTDVFAFGVLLLEIISGKKPVDGSHHSLHSWAKPILSKGEMEKLIDPRLGGHYDMGQLRRLALAASLCIRASSTWRPSMSEVLEVMVAEKLDEERWDDMPMEEEEEWELYGFEDLECDYDEDDDDNTSFSASPVDSSTSTV